jgi:Fic family protein
VKRAPLDQRLRAFFDSNRGEELTLDQIAGKFGVCRNTARNAITTLRKQGYLGRVIVYRREAA